MEQLITSAYEHQLAYIYHKIDNRGILTDRHKMAALRRYCNDSINSLCDSLSTSLGTKVYIGADNQPATGTSTNINYSPNLQALLKGIGFTLPKLRVKDKNTHEYTTKDSANKLILQKVLADQSLWPTLPYLDAKKVIQDLLEIHVTAKIKSTYANAKLFNNVYFSTANVAGTVTGRRSSRRHSLGLGGNNQNIPKYTTLAGKFRETFIARPGRIFFFVDQVKAEEWPVSALAENYNALEELRNEINRHLNLASFMFSIPTQVLQDSIDRGDLDSILCYYLAKKTRHANNYGMRALRMSEQLAAEGHSISKDTCASMLEKVNQADPNVQLVFHEYIKKEAWTTKLLRTPLGRERQVLGLRQGDKNFDLMNELYSWIPQSVVGDNTGLAISYISSLNDYILQDGHDSICQEPPDTEGDLFDVFVGTQEAFDREIVFHNGISIKIPIEASIGYDWKHTVRLKEYTFDAMIDAYRKLQLMCEELKDTESERENGKDVNEAVAGSLQGMD